jgi:tetratricopeptide (TPR) repeat protein
MKAGEENPRALLQAGIAAARAGERARARALLTRAAEQDEQNVLAWLWLSGMVDSLEERRSCLEKVLAIDPGNAAAKKGLSQINAQASQPPADPIDQKLKEGIAAARAGRREHAHDLLMQVVAQDDRNATAWLWLSGLVDTLEDREICLENVITIEPDNQVAHKGLERVRQQMSSAPPPPEIVPDTPVASPVEPAAAPLPFSDPFADEYLCPFCAEPTEHNDRKCPSCDEKLWVSLRRNEKRSTNMWIVIAIQTFSTIQYAIIPGMLAFLLFGLQGMGASFLLDFYADAAGLSPDTIPMLLSIAFFVSLIPFLFSAGVLVALFLRWKPVFYLLLAMSVLQVFWVALTALGGALESPLLGLLAGGVTNAVFQIFWAITRATLTFQIQDDFAFERRRMTLRIDPDVNSAPTIMARGFKYADMKMWGMAALHLRRAISMQASRMDGRAALVLVYLKLKRFDLAETALEDARRIESDNPQLAELETLVQKERATAGSLRAV